MAILPKKPATKSRPSRGASPRDAAASRAAPKDGVPLPATASVEHADRAIMDMCNAAIVVVAADGRICAWNRGAEKLFGYEETRALDMAVTKLIPQRLRRKHRAAFIGLVKDGSEERFDRVIRTRAVRSDGVEFPMEMAIGGGLRGGQWVFTAVIRDVTDRERVVAQLNTALQRLRFHADRMPLAFIVWDTDFNVVEWNPAAERIFGYSADEAMGRNAYDLVVPPDVAVEVEDIWSALLAGDTTSHSINENVRKDGSKLTCEWFNTALHDATGRIDGVASMAMDVSEREALEAQLRDAQKLESLGALAAGVSHDFNSLLMVIVGRTSLLRSLAQLPVKAEEHLDVIDEAGGRAKELIKHLLAYARPGRHNPQPAKLNEVIRDAHRLVEVAVGSQHSVNMSLARRLPSVLVDRGQIEQIIMNLCINAQQAMPNGGDITIATEVTTLTRDQSARCVPPVDGPGRYVEMRVIDGGHGVDSDLLARIFDPFFSTKPKGHGLGLAIVQGILRQHGGGAQVESQPGEGMTFRVFLPVGRRAGHAVRKGAAVRPASRSPKSNTRG